MIVDPNTQPCDRELARYSVIDITLGVNKHRSGGRSRGRRIRFRVRVKENCVVRLEGRDKVGGDALD